MKKVVAILATLALVCVLSACGTTGATVNSAGTQATLTAKGSCQDNMHVNWWYEVRRITDGNGPWNAVGPSTRVDVSGTCASHNMDHSDKALAPYTTNVTPDNVYEYRIAYQQDGNPVVVCDKNSRCATKGSADEANERWDNFETTPVGGSKETLAVGQDYDVNDPSGAVSGSYACNIDSDLNKPQLSYQETYAIAEITGCRNDMSLKLTCKVDMSVFIYPYTFHFFDTDYGNETENCVAIWGEVVHYSAGEYAGMRADWYLRLEHAGRKWTSAFQRQPHRGNCETYYVSVPDYGGANRHVLHCWAYWGKYSIGSGR